MSISGFPFLKIDPYSRSANVVIKDEEPEDGANFKFSNLAVRNANVFQVPVSHYVWLTDLVHENRTDVRLRERKFDMIPQRLARLHNLGRLMLYVRDDLDARGTVARENTPGFALPIGRNSNRWWCGVAYLGVYGQESADEMAVALKTLASIIVWERGESHNFSCYHLVEVGVDGTTKLLKAAPRTCAACGQTKIELRRCGRCVSVFYCDKTCQTSHWKIHRKICRTIEGFARDEDPLQEPLL